MTARTPLQQWPIVKHAGRAGYSARHFAMVSPTSDTPLLVAERLAARDGGDRAAVWAELCQSWPALLAVLAKHASEPGIKPFLKQAQKACSVIHQGK